MVKVEIKRGHRKGVALPSGHCWKQQKKRKKIRGLHRFYHCALYCYGFSEMYGFRIGRAAR